MSSPEPEIAADVEEKKHKKQFRFSSTDDERLLTQVIAIFPYGLGHGKKIEGWKKVSTALNSIGIGVDHRRCNERTSILIENFRKAESTSRRLSGVDEKFTETDRLLSELVEMIDYAELKNTEITAKKIKKLKENEEAAERIRNAGLVELNLKRRRDSDLHSTGESTGDCEDERKSSLKRTRTKTESLKDFIEESNQKMIECWKEDHDLRREELRMQQQKLDMEEKDRQANQSLILALTQALLKKLDG